jgi:hypothetical protein
MIVRLVVHLGNRALVRALVHATRHEPVAIDATQGVVAFDVPYSRIEAVVNRLAKCGVGDFLAHVTPTPENRIADPGDEG